MALEVHQRLFGVDLVQHQELFSAIREGREADVHRLVQGDNTLLAYVTQAIPLNPSGLKQQWHRRMRHDHFPDDSRCRPVYVRACYSGY